jgi:hypothetical protein
MRPEFSIFPPIFVVFVAMVALPACRIIPCFPLRMLFWRSFSWCFDLFHLLILSTSSVCVCAVIMVFSGYMGAVSVVTTVKWFWFLIGIGVFIPVLYTRKQHHTQIALFQDSLTACQFVHFFAEIPSTCILNGPDFMRV